MLSANVTSAAMVPPIVPLPPPAPPAPPPPPPPKIHVKVFTAPPKHAKVFWGKKLLGETPLDIERVQGSGPMDLVLRADDFVPLHTRAYTDGNNKLVESMTKLSDKMSLFGAKADAPPPAAPATAAPATPTTHP